MIAINGNDTLTGNGGGDTFVFKTTIGNDVITDLHPTATLANPADVIDLTAFHFANYNALLAAAVDTPAGEVLHLGPSAMLTLDNVHAANLNASLFHL